MKLSRMVNRNRMITEDEGKQILKEFLIYPTDYAYADLLKQINTRVFSLTNKTTIKEIKAELKLNPTDPSIDLTDIITNKDYFSLNIIRKELNIDGLIATNFRYSFFIRINYNLILKRWTMYSEILLKITIDSTLDNKIIKV